MCYYKFNFLKNYNGLALELVQKIMVQWLGILNQWYLSGNDLLFSKKKYSNIHIVDDGGWHFSYLNTPELIEQKLKSYTHHREYDLNPIGVDNIKKRIENRESVYNLNVDMRKNQFSEGVSLNLMEIDELPDYIIENKIKFKDWLD